MKRRALLWGAGGAVVAGACFRRVWREPAPRAAAVAALELTDFAGDGTPDFLRLEDSADRQAFTGWFSFLAEAQHFLTPQDRPREVNDCAALARFAFREALREHDAAWAGGLKLAVMPALAPVRKYHYPGTALGARLFRVTPGPFAPADLTSQAFAEFADAETLRRYNCHFLSRDWRHAAPGDLLFYRQVEQELPFHVMIYLGPSHFEGGGPWVVYHTGPLDGARGEIRRPAVEELLRHPSPRWHPRQGNVNFLGVYRWNILRDTG
ncbi:MAG: DUF1175 family protein [Acidobacteria bacterium]|nr:DUF1175 family protein [Acidobacteriota bacterium]